MVDIDEAYRLVDAMKLLILLGMCNPRGGNGSVRIKNKMLITPSGLAKHNLGVEDLVIYDLETGEIGGRYKPSIELYVHALTYEKRRDIRAILHGHPPYTLALTDLGLSDWWKTGLVEVEYSVGRVVVATPYPPGSRELAEEVSNRFAERARIVIVPKHGVFAGSRDVYEALDAIVALEETAKYVFVSRVMEKLGIK